MKVRRDSISGHNLFTTFRDRQGDTSLHRAVEQHDYEKVNFYAGYPQLINSVNHSGETPLHYCAFTDFPEAVEVLLQRGADINAVNTLKQTPVMLAILNRAYKTIERLLSARTAFVAKNETRQVKVDPFMTDYRELSLAHYALLMNDPEIKRIVFRELAKRKIFFIQADEPNWFNPRFITLYTRSSHRAKMLNECKDTFR